MNGIDPKVVKFFIALLVTTAVIEIVDNVSKNAAVILSFVIILGLLLNNPYAIALITLGGNALADGVRT